MCAEERLDVWPACQFQQHALAAADVSADEKAFNDAITSIRERYLERVAANLGTDIQGIPALRTQRSKGEFSSSGNRSSSS